MAKLRTILRKQKSSRNGKRLYNLRDMAEVKHDEAKKNARIKRGEEKPRPVNGIAHCGCGMEGCFIHYGHSNRNQFGGVNDHHNSGNIDKTI